MNRVTWIQKVQDENAMKYDSRREMYSREALWVQRRGKLCFEERKKLIFLKEKVRILEEDEREWYDTNEEFSREKGVTFFMFVYLSVLYSSYCIPCIIFSHFWSYFLLFIPISVYLSIFYSLYRNPHHFFTPSSLYRVCSPLSKYPIIPDSSIVSPLYTYASIP